MRYARLGVAKFVLALCVGALATMPVGASLVLRGARVAGSYGPTFQTPLPVALTGWVSGVAPSSALTQPGSRLYYINPNHTTGNPSGIDNPSTLANCQANIMYWNGTDIVDAQGYTSPGGVGTPYGTDPYNPSGTVNEFTTYTSVGPRASAAQDICGTYTTVGYGAAPSSFARAGFSDYWLIKRGTTLSLTSDKAAWNTLKGVSATLGGLALPRGASAAHPAVLASYGSTATARPTITQPTTDTNYFFYLTSAGLNYVLYTGLVIDGGDRSAGAQYPGFGSFNAIAAGDDDIYFEDIWFKRAATSFSLGSGGSEYTPPDSTMAGGVTFTGVIFSDSFRNNTGSSCLFYGGKKNTSRLNLNSVIFMRCGMTRDPTRFTPFVPDGTTSIAGDTVSSLVGNGTTVTVTTTNTANTSHGVAAGDSVTITGANEAGFNGTFTVASAAADSTTFTYNSTGSGTATGSISYTTVYRYNSSNSSLVRNAYISGAKDIQNSAMVDSVAILGASGFQNRSGSTMTGNFFYEGYVSIGATQGASLGVLQDGTITDNVLQRYAPSTTTNGATANPGWGWLIGGGLYQTEVARNIFSQAQYSTSDTSGVGYGLTITGYYGDTDEPFHRATTGLNIHDNIFDVVFSGSAAPSAILEDEGANRTEPVGQFGFPITGTWAAGQTLTCNIGTVASGSVTGTPAYQWEYNGSPIAGETNPTHVALAGELTGATGSGRGLRCFVTGLNFSGAQGLGITGVTITNNVISNQTTASSSARKQFGIPTGNTATSATNTVYTTNRTYSTIAAAKAGEAWSDETRTLKTYLQSLGYTVTTSDGAQEYYNLATQMQRGNWDARLNGKKINNYIRAGRGLSPIQ